jgi:uncharacterized protein YuzE
MCCDLLKLFTGVSDGRVRQGRDHPVAAVLALATAAVVAGMKGYTAITGWVADVPPAILTDLYLRSGAAPASPPSKTTIWRVLTDADAEAYDRRANAVYLHLTDQPLPPGHSTTRAQAPPGLDAFIALDWRGNQLIGIEILDASTVLPADLLNHAEIIG